MKLPDILHDETVLNIIRLALQEDLGGAGDVTTSALVPEDKTVNAVIVSRGRYVLSGAGIAMEVFRQIDPAIACRTCVEDGNVIEPEQEIITISGCARSILAAERTALNFLQRMTGIASLTRSFVDKVKQYGVTILDTRKTTPALRVFEKYAVLCGGGENHRMGLYDRILIKDNHRRILHDGMCNLASAVEMAEKRFPGIPVEVEVENEAELENALGSNPDWILLDNMPPEQMKHCVNLCAGRSKLEASGGITLGNVEEIARTGINAISLGCLTHSAPAADLSLEIQ